MAVIVNKNDDQNDELSRRISADVRAKMYGTSGSGDDDDYDDGSGLKRKDPDFAEDSEYIKDFQKTGRFGWVWIVLIVLAILSIISIVMF